MACLLAVGLSGCSRTSGDNIQVNVQTLPPLSAGKGAVAGLVIDDRYRPVPDALVLLTPLGLTTTSDAEGQFYFADLEPGSYVAEVQAPDHEAAPKTVDVQVGEYSELEVQARRLFSGLSDLITVEYSIFIPCGFSAIFVTVITDCLLDLSGDSYRTGFYADYTPYKKNATYLVVEFKATQPDGYYVPIQGCNHRYNGGTFNGDYQRYIMKRGNVTPDDVNRTKGYDRWQNDCKSVGTTLFYVGGQQDTFKQYLHTEWGAGARLAVKATFLTSLFVGPPTVDIQSYGPLRPPGG